MYPESVVQYINLGKAYFYIFPFKTKYVEEGKKFLRGFFSATKVNIYLFRSNTHVQSILVRGSRPRSKNSFFLRKGKLPPKKFIMKTRLNSLPSEFGSSSDDTGRKLIKSTTIISFNTLSAIFEAAFFQSARAHHCYAADVSVFEKFK